MIMTVSTEEVPANSVPAAAVIRGGRALFGMTGRKEFVGGFLSWFLKFRHNPKREPKLKNLSLVEDSGILAEG